MSIDIHAGKFHLAIIIGFTHKQPVPAFMRKPMSVVFNRRDPGVLRVQIWRPFMVVEW